MVWCLTWNTHRLDIDDESDTMLQQHILRDSGHSLLNKDQVGPDVNYPLYIVLQELPFLQKEQCMSIK